ncbi:MAG: DNA methyltransferase [Thermodesulfobacteriota bacterium]
MPENQDWNNQLYYGDNLHVLREHVADESVDLIYLDPPFNSNATYNVLFGEKNGSQSQAQITAFDDTWHWGEESEQTYRVVVTEGWKKLADLLQALRSFLGQNDMMAYLVMMAARLAELHRVLKSTGSIFLHCDPTASHYLKVLMDSIFDVCNFRNEIVWQRSGAHNFPTRALVRTNDIILFYSKTNDFFFKTLFTEYGPEQLSRFRPDEKGRLYKAENLTFSTPNKARQFEWRGTRPAANRSWGADIEQLESWWAEGRILKKRDGTPRLDGLKIYFDETKGKPLTTNWVDIPRIGNTSSERLGYPTQKPEALLDRILSMGSNKFDVVLDPFCGCGTTVNVAERLHRRWIGIDITHLAIALIRNRLHDTFGNELSPYEVLGAPKYVASAKTLAEQDRYQFEWWALSLVDARPAQDKKKGSDSGIDGFINFFDDGSGRAKKIIVQVKSGNVTTSQIRDLKAVVEREKAVIGAFVTLNPSTKPMKEEALSAGYYVPELLGKEHDSPKIQILTIADLLSGAKLKYPRLAVTTFKKAARKHKDPNPTQENCFDDNELP